MLLSENGLLFAVLAGIVVGFHTIRFLVYLVRDRARNAVKGKSFAITGASGALGSDVCMQLCAEGARELVLWDVREKELEALKARIRTAFPEVKVASRAVNLLSQVEIASAARDLLERHDIDCLIQVAGIVFSDFFHLVPSSHDRATFDINVMAQVDLMRILIPAREAANKPLHIVGVSSVAAFNGGAGMAVYGASKAALKGFYEGVAVELALRRSVCSVSLFCPGQFQSKLFEGASVPLVKPLTATDMANALVYQSVVRRLPISIYPGYLSILFVFANLVHVVFNSFLIVPLNSMAKWKGRDYATEVLTSETH